jgi:inner membrane protein
MPDLSMLQPWMWLVGGLVLIAVEIIAPGIFLFWLGLAALIVGMFALAIDLSWQAEGIIFVASAFLMVGLGRAYARRKGISDKPFLNETGNALIGKEYVLADPIANGFGTVRINDSVWRVAGLNAPRGQRVKVVGVDGATLKVESV